MRDIKSKADASESMVQETLAAMRATIITEGAASVEYQYVGQCSNRGHCDGETGLCKCYAGFAGDNCDSFNAMSM